jgi:hypothetical protein
MRRTRAAACRRPTPSSSIKSWNWAALRSHHRIAVYKPEGTPPKETKLSIEIGSWYLDEFGNPTREITNSASKLVLGISTSLATQRVKSKNATSNPVLTPQGYQRRSCGISRTEEGALFFLIELKDV